MFYGASNPNLSTRDWFALSFNAIPQSLIARAAGEKGGRYPANVAIAISDGETLADLTVPDFVVEPDEIETTAGVVLYAEPDPDAYNASETSCDLSAEERADYESDLAAWKAYDREAREEITRRRERDLLPMWGTMFQTDETGDRVTEALLAAGCRVYDLSCIDLDGVTFGIDGAGYGFLGAHWIPLRASIAVRQYMTAADRAKLADLLASEAAAEGATRENAEAIDAIRNGTNDGE